MVTETSTAPAEPAGDTAVTCVALFTTTDVAAVEPKFTVAPVRSVPVITTLVPPAVVPLFGVTVVIVGAAGKTEKLCCTCVAAAKFELPAWSALIRQVPAPVKLTTPPAIEQVAELEGSTENTTDRPDVAVAVGV